MKIIKLTADRTLVDFFRIHCPSGMAVIEQVDGYWVRQELCLRHEGRWKNDYTPIAHIDGCEITMIHPQYISDIQDTISKWESLGGREVTIRTKE